MPDPKPGEQYTPEGRTIVDEGVFEDPSEEGAETTPGEETAPSETTPETTPKEETPEETPEEGDKPDKGEGEEDPKKPEGGEEPLLAGKYKTKEELEKAYQTLGGDPSKHKTTEALVEAYQFRESEFTRIKQEQAEQARLAALIPDNNGKEKVTPNAPVTVDDLMKKVDWTKVTDAQTLGQQLFTIMLENMPKAQQEMTPEQLVEKVMPVIKEREEKQKALSTIEGEVPRLTKDKAFRKAFAYHVIGGREDGTKYPRTAEGLREAMKDFLKWARNMSEESNRQTEIQNRAKKAATPPADPGQGMPGGNKGDEADEIIEAYAEKNKRYNY